VAKLEGCFQAYFQRELGDVLGMSGQWGTAVPNTTRYHYIGTGRDAAKFGVLLAHGGQWHQTPIVSAEYFAEMTNTNPFAEKSNAANRSYGYLTWLAGKPDGLTPGSNPWASPPDVRWLPGPVPFAPAPSDTLMAIGAGGQYIHVTHHGSAGNRPASLVLVRLGTAPRGGFDSQNDLIATIWQKMNRIVCNAPAASTDPCP
jgi:hypothetical protein